MNIIPINNLNTKELEIYTKLNEPQLLHFFEPEEGIFIAETPLVIERALSNGYEPLSFFIEEKILDTPDIDIIKNCRNTPAIEANQLAEPAAKSVTSTEPDIPIYTAPLNVINSITGYNLTHGMLSAMRRKKMPEYSQISAMSNHMVLLEDVENPTNVGALFRSAAALGADSVILTKDSSDPLYRRAARVSMGTVFQIPWIKTASHTLIDNLKSDGFCIISMALSDRALPLNDNRLDKIEKSVVVFGNEGTGISDGTLCKSDYIVKIPMQHGVDSLNVAAAGTVAFWRFFN